MKKLIYSLIFIYLTLTQINVFNAPIFDESLEYRFLECIRTNSHDENSAGRFIVEIENFNETCVRINQTIENGFQIYLYISQAKENRFQIHIETENCSNEFPQLHLSSCEDSSEQNEFIQSNQTLSRNSSNINQVDDNQTDSIQLSTSYETTDFLFQSTIYETTVNLDLDSDSDLDD